ncbi:type II secretion system protein [bacterium]|nr:type II secretion system protein [bacterium]
MKKIFVSGSANNFPSIRTFLTFHCKKLTKSCHSEVQISEIPRFALNDTEICTVESPIAQSMKSLRYLRKRGRYAFTLSEVLITLGIIGVVAALTIPALIKNYQKKQYYTGFMKARSQLENVLRQYEDDYGVLMDAASNEYMTDEKLKNFASYFKVARIFTPDNYGEVCAGYRKLGISDTYDGKGRQGGSENICGYGFITLDGILFSLRHNGFSLFGSDGYVDINGPDSGPNILGRDVFGVYLDPAENHLFCGNIWGPNKSCIASDKTSIVNESCYGSIKLGFFCGARLIEEGKMNY